MKGLGACVRGKWGPVVSALAKQQQWPKSAYQTPLRSKMDGASLKVVVGALSSNMNTGSLVTPRKSDVSFEIRIL